MTESKSIILTRDYFDGLGVKDYTISDVEDGGQNIILINIPSDFNKGLKLFLGKNNQNMIAFRTFLHLYGFIEGRNNFVVVKLTK